MSQDSLSAAFLEGLSNHQLRYQACTDCGAPQSLSRYACRQCGSARLEWRRATGRGSVYATTVVARAPAEEFHTLAPYTLAIVQLDEGPRLMAHGEAHIAIGDRVVADFFQFAGHTLVRFRPERSR
jgi:uncharacterized OB-fold protein